MNYKDFNDYELLDYTYSCNEDANEILLYKYRPLIVNIANKYVKYALGVDLNDLVQEGLVGLNEAIKYYDENKDASFGTYAKLCIERKITDYVKNTKRNKYKILNESINLEINNDDMIIDKHLVDNRSNPSDLLENEEREKEILNKLMNQLTDYEQQVFELKKNNFNYKEIASILDKDPKAIDNALQRIKNKLIKIMKEY